VVVISHDSQLLSVVCDDEERSEVWLVEDGKVETYNGYFQVRSSNYFDLKFTHLQVRLL
jgi:ATPase subunit of ABC transporter with duplicated ATPase domains